MELTELELELTRMRYTNKTIYTYMFWMKHLSNYHREPDLSNITLEQIVKFINYQKRKRASSATIHQAAKCFGTVFNRILNKNYDFQSIELPARNTEPPEILTSDELIDLLNNAKPVYRLIFAVKYSAGLTLSELRNIRVTDIDFDNRTLAIAQAHGKSSRRAVLAEYLVPELLAYLDEHDPEKWLFEATSPGKQISSSAIQKAFKQSILNAGIKKNVSPKCLKYSYVKHLEADGVPLRSILYSLGMSHELNARTFSFYSNIGYEHINLSYSPLDRIMFSGEAGVDIRPIKRALSNVQNEDEREYLQEAIECLRHGLLRAAVIFSWTAAIRNVHNRIMKHSPRSRDGAIQKYMPKAKSIKSVNDFAHIRDSIVLEASQELDIFDKNQKAMLLECLNLRNKCGHPGKYRPKPLKVGGYLEDIVQIVFIE